MNDIDIPFVLLKEQIDRLKVVVDKCHIPSIYVHTYKIASMVKSVEPINLSEVQKRILKKLDEDTLKQFERLSKGRCSCKISMNI